MLLCLIDQILSPILSFSNNGLQKFYQQKILVKVINLTVYRVRPSMFCANGSFLFPLIFCLPQVCLI